MLFEGKVAIVTGGASGIGEATAWKLAREGASVIVADRDENGGGRVAAEISATGGTAVFQRIDISSVSDVEALIRRAVDGYGGLHLAVNNAGFGHPPARLHELEAGTWDALMDVNLRGTWLCLRAELAHMVEAGGGAIVNTASVAGLKGVSGLSAYSTSKHAVIGLTRNAAIDYVTDGIRVNAVAPGTVATPLMLGQPKEVVDAFTALMPAGRLAEPDEVANVIAWLLSDQASYVSGEVVVIDHAAMQV